MHRILLSLATLLALTPIAHADALNFAVTGAGHNYTFSLDSSRYILDRSHAGSVFAQAGDGTLDGVGTYTVDLGFLLPNELEFGFQVPNYGYDPIGFDLRGDTYLKETGNFLTPGQYPYVDVLPGNYQLNLISSNAGDVPQGTPFTLIITPQVPTSPTPEPATLALLATGALCLFSRIRRGGTPAQQSVAQSPH